MRFKANFYYIFLILFSFLFINIGWSQDPEKRFSDPTPDVDPIGSLEDFVALFEVWDLGNLHVYAKPRDMLEYDYYFKGKPVNQASRTYLPLEVKRATIGTDEQVYAIGEISGVGRNDLYIIRIEEAKEPNRIMLTRLVKAGKLEKIATIAYFKRKENGYEQLDTWIQDVNGDGLPDMIRKTRTLDAQGKEMDVETQVLLQLRDGTYQITSDVEIQPADYKFEEIL